MVTHPLFTKIFTYESDTYVDLLAKGDNAEVVRYLVEDGVSRLVGAGAQCLVICSNTAHVAVAEVGRRWPALPVLHIADTTARAALAAGCATVGLLGTEPTMRDGSWLKERLQAHGLKVNINIQSERL